MRCCAAAAVAVMLLAACTGGSAEGADGPNPTPTTGVAASVSTDTTSTTEPPEDPNLPAGLEEMELVSAVAPGRLVDEVRSNAELRHGLDGGGDEPNPANTPTRFFTGDDADVVVNLVSPAESANLNPAGSLFVFQADGVNLLDPSFNRIANAPGRFSWNVMQRGLAGNAGGQWKMSLVNESDGSVNAQCVVRDADNRSMRVNSPVDMEAGTDYTISCIFDDVANLLWVDVNQMRSARTEVVRRVINGTEQVVFDPAQDIATEPFGDSNPAGGGTCGDLVADGIGNVIAVGNKPACGITLTADDRFQGEIAAARIWRAP